MPIVRKPARPDVPAEASVRSEISVRDFGAAADGQRDDRAAFQAAVEKAHGGGGGRVVVPAGKYLVGGIRLLEGVELHLQKGAILWANHEGQYPKEAMRRVVWAYEARQVALTGEGEIDCHALFPPTRQPPREPYAFDDYVGGCYEGGDQPASVMFRNCRDSRIEGVTLRNSGEWTCYLLHCDDTAVRNVTIRNSPHSRWTDGIDIESGRNILVEGCDIITGDDAICIKSGKRGVKRAAKGITVRDCTVASETNGLKIGTETARDISDVLFERIKVRAPPDGPGPFGGVSIEMTGACTLENVVVRDIEMQDVRAPIFIKLNKRPEYAEGRQAPGIIRQVLIENVTSIHGVEKRQDDICSSITGYAGHVVKGITLRHIRLLVRGGKKHDGKDVPDPVGGYPESRMFGRLPAYGFYLRHAEDVRLENIEVKTRKRDARELIVTENVKNLTLSHVRDQTGTEVRAGEAPNLDK